MTIVTYAIINLKPSSLLRSETQLPLYRSPDDEEREFLDEFLEPNRLAYVFETREKRKKHNIVGQWAKLTAQGVTPEAWVLYGVHGPDSHHVEYASVIPFSEMKAEISEIASILNSFMAVVSGILDV